MKRRRYKTPLTGPLARPPSPLGEGNHFTQWALQDTPHRAARASIPSEKIRRVQEQLRATRSADGLFAINGLVPIGLVADVVVVRQVGNNQPAKLERVDGGLLFVKHLATGADEDSVGNRAFPLGIERRHQIVNLRRAKNQ